MFFSRTNDPGEAQYERYINLHLFRMVFMFMVRCFLSHLVLPYTNRHQNKLIYGGLVVYVYGLGA